MNAIGEIAKLAKIRLFANDTNVFIVSENPILLKQNAENILLALSEWKTSHVIAYLLLHPNLKQSLDT